MDYHIKQRKWEEIFKYLLKRNDIKAKDEHKTRKFIEAIWYIRPAA